MKKLLLALFIICLYSGLNAQNLSFTDSLQKEYIKEKDPKIKVKILENLAYSTMNTDPVQAEKYAEELIQIAEKTRDREIMVKAYIANGVRCSAWSGIKDYKDRAMEYFDKAFAIAQKSQLTKYESFILVQQSALQLNVPDIDKASKYLDQASTLSAQQENDSSRAVIAMARGNIQLARNEKIDALRSYLSALRIADKIANPGLQRQSQLKLSDFYAGIEDYDKAIDYRVAAGIKLKEMSLSNRIGYYQIEDIKAIGDLYAAKKSYPLAIESYQESIDMADSLNYPPSKVPGYIGLFNVYLTMKEPQKSMEFMLSPNGTRLTEYFSQLNMRGIIDQAYAIIYSEMGKLDSAGKYFERSAPFFENYSNPAAKMSSFVQTAFYHKRKGENQKAVDLLLKARTIANTHGQLEAGLEISKNLDTLYDKMGDYRQSKIYSAEYFQFKDSLQTINKEKELSQVEADDELQQLKKQELAAAEKKRQRNNIQYLAITIGIATTFLLLVLLGMFRVSARTIKVIGFFAFLLFFEFIFLIFKKNIYAFSHGEPWIDLSFMIALAAILVPLHHWLEHKVLHYLTDKNKLTSVGESLKERFRGKDKVESLI